jgi:DNA-directed RNA polymerase specialized sigma subunit
MMELFDEENAYTTLAEQWENYGTLNYIEDERRESLADSEVERGELLHQIFTMIRNTLTEQETDILCAYYGLQTKRLSTKRIAEKYSLSESRVLRIVRESERKLQFSDEAISIWKYLYRKDTKILR